MNETKDTTPKDLGKRLTDTKVYETTVAWFDPKLGYGFLRWGTEGAAKKNDLYFHFTDIQIDGYRQVAKAQKVSFQIGECLKLKDGKSEMRPCALNVTPLEPFEEAKARMSKEKPVEPAK